MFKAPVSGDEDSESRRFRSTEQHTVLQSSPCLLLHCSNVVSDQMPGELPRQLLIEKNQQAR
jgi:hypothetical protein